MPSRRSGRNTLTIGLGLFCLLGAGVASSAWSQAREPEPPKVPPAESDLRTTEDWNRRMQELLHAAERGTAPAVVAQEYRIGPEDLLEISVFEAPELNRQLRVSASGEISLPLLGAVQAAGLTPKELEFVLQELLRRTYMKDPHVGVYVREMESHPVSVFGAVKKPGVYQIRGARTLLEVLSLAEGLADDAGDTVLVMRAATFQGIANRSEREATPQTSGSDQPAATAVASANEEPVLDSPGEGSIEINLKSLLESGGTQDNIPVYPGDIVKVTRAGIVYVVGEVKKPGGFVLEHNENISVLQALALAEGLTRTASKGNARIIRSDEETGERAEIPIDLGRVLAGKAPDPLLKARDIVFVPNSMARSALYRAGEAAISIVSGVIIWRR